MQLKLYNVTIRRFDPTQPGDSGELIVLPVDCPDEEHAIAATLSNCIAFTMPKYKDGGVVPVAFTSVAVAPR